MSTSNSYQAEACRIADDLVANGARFTFKPATGAMPASFTYELARGSDRWRCRGLIAEAKADPDIWRELVAEVARRCNGGAG